MLVGFAEFGWIAEFGSIGETVAMSNCKRQRFFVELSQDEVTMVSWKQLLANGERISTSEIAAPPSNFPAKKTVVPGLNRATIPSNSNTTESNPLKSRGKLKLSLSNSAKATTTKPADQKPSLDDRTLIKYTSRVPKSATHQIQPKSNEKRFVEAKLEFGQERDSVAMKFAGSKGKLHRSMPGKTSCRTKKKTQACFCCSKKEPETQT